MVEITRSISKYTITRLCGNAEPYPRHANYGNAIITNAFFGMYNRIKSYPNISATIPQNGRMTNFTIKEIHRRKSRKADAMINEDCMYISNFLRYKLDILEMSSIFTNKLDKKLSFHYNKRNENH